MSRDLAAGILGLILLPGAIAFMWMSLRHTPGTPEYRRLIVPYAWVCPAVGTVIMLLNGSTWAVIAAAVTAGLTILCLGSWLSQVRQERWEARMAKKHDVTIRRPDE